jgi:transcriptional regulator GlxA family with amidase domain
MQKAIKIAIVVLENTLLSGVTGTDDIFSMNNHYCKQEKEPLLETHYVSPYVISGSRDKKMLIQSELISNKDSYDVVIIPPISAGNELIEEIPKLTEWLIQMYHKGALMCSACVGSFVLAQTGLLDFKKATTHWMLDEAFASSFPNVSLHSEKILIDEGRLITAGGVSAYIDLALYLIERLRSNSSANTCANLLLFDRGRDSQRCYKDLTKLFLIDDEEIKTLLTWMKKNHHKPLSIQDMAKQMKLGERTFLRRFKKVVHLTPNQYLQNLRIEEAKALLINSSRSFEEITYAVGFNNESSFRRLFLRETSLNPGAYRMKFQ